MAVYFDSSVILSILKNEPRMEEALKIWRSADKKISSILLESECLVSLQRINDLHKKTLPKNWLKTKIALLDEFLNEMELRLVDDKINFIIRNNEHFSGCRTLDAIHIATGLYYANYDPHLIFATFDQKMQQVVKKMNFRLIP